MLPVLGPAGTPGQVGSYRTGSLKVQLSASKRSASAGALITIGA